MYMLFLLLDSIPTEMYLSKSKFLAASTYTIRKYVPLSSIVLVAAHADDIKSGKRHNVSK